MDFPYWYSCIGKGLPCSLRSKLVKEISYGYFSVFSSFLLNKHSQGVFFFRFEDGLFPTCTLVEADFILRDVKEGVKTNFYSHFVDKGGGGGVRRCG